MAAYLWTPGISFFDEIYYDVRMNKYFFTVRYRGILIKDSVVRYEITSINAIVIINTLRKEINTYLNELWC